MQGKHLYEYAVIRLVPKVEREEFFNVGIILFSKRAKFRYEGGRSYRCSGRPGTVSVADSSAECIYPDFTSASGFLR